MELNLILVELTTLFRKELSRENIELKMEMNAKDVDGWDSLNHMALIAAVEERFSIKFTFKEIMKMKNIEDMCLAIQSKLTK